jgi:ABC-2 type transport system permease protein
MNRLRNWEINPIIVKELRSRMRGSRSFITVTAALILMGLVGYALYRVSLASLLYTSSPVSPQIGQMLFTGLAFFELLIIAMITPSVTASEISGEKEKQTYEMLLTTPLSPISILWGKLVAAMSYVFLVLFASVPMASLVFIFGGVAVRDMLKTLIALIVIALMFGVIGMFFSALLHRTGRATVVSYMTIGLLMLGPIFAAMLASIFRQGDPPRWILIPSPIAVLASTFQPSVNSQAISSTLWMFGSPINWILGNPSISQTSIPRPSYHYGLPLYVAVTVILYLISTRLVMPVRRWKIQGSEALLGLIILLGFIGLATLGFLLTTNRYENIQISSPATELPAILPGGAINPGSLPLDTPGPMIETPYPAPKGAISPGDAAGSSWLVLSVCLSSLADVLLPSRI